MKSAIRFILLITLIAACNSGNKEKKQIEGMTIGGGADTIALKPAPDFNADNALEYIRHQCSLDARVPGSAAHEACANWIEDEFKRLGCETSIQRTMLKGYDQEEMECINICAKTNPESTDRILITAHWDSRQWADNDPNEANHHQAVPAANDGASGVAVMLELARLIQQTPLSYGVDFVCFDLEDQGTPEWVTDINEQEERANFGFWCLGSRYWASQALASGYHARFCINLDMVGAHGAQFAYEQYSMQNAAPLVDMVWRLAAQLGYSKYFPQREGGPIMDDHLMVQMYAQIPAIDIVPNVEGQRSSFGNTWHTLEDTPENIDPVTLKAVGQTLTQLLYNDND